MAEYRANDSPGGTTLRQVRGALNVGPETRRRHVQHRSAVGVTATTNASHNLCGRAERRPAIGWRQRRRRPPPSTDRSTTKKLMRHRFVYLREKRERVENGKYFAFGVAGEIIFKRYVAKIRRKISDVRG